MNKMKEKKFYDKIENSISNFPINGFAKLGCIKERKKIEALRKYINSKKVLSKNIFYSSEEEFMKKGRWEKYAPGTNHNFLENIDISFIEQNNTFVKSATKLLGADYKIIKKSIIRSVSSKYLPAWLKPYIKDIGRPNLNPFIKDEYQDIQHFYCTDYHQDKTRPKSNFITFYLYLDYVNREYSALRILEGSHILGMTPYPHNLRRSYHNKKVWYYTDIKGKTINCKEYDITGGPGTLSCFHGLTLHGTPVNNSKDPRISIRFLLAPKKLNEENIFYLANRNITGPKSISIHRSDVNKKGKYLRTGSALEGYEI